MKSKTAANAAKTSKHNPGRSGVLLEFAQKYAAYEKQERDRNLQTAVPQLTEAIAGDVERTARVQKDGSVKVDRIALSKLLSASDAAACIVDEGSATGLAKSIERVAPLSAIPGQAV